MPFQLINKIDDLLRLESMKKHNLGPADELTKLGAKLSEKEMEMVDDIVDSAKNLFGVGLQPTVRQINLMAARGIQVEPGETIHAAWKTGVIKTPKGSITY